MTRTTSTIAMSTPVVPTFHTSSFNIDISPVQWWSWTTWIFHFPNQGCVQLSCNRWSDIQVLTFAKSKLQGPALTFIIQKTSYEQFNTLASLFSALSPRFKQPSVCRSHTEFNSISFLPGESIRNLTHRLDALASCAHKVIKDPIALNAIKSNKLIAILPNEYRKHILQSNISTYTEAVEKATLLQDCDINNEFICQASSNKEFFNWRYT